MTYNHLTISELSFIQNFWNQGVKAYIVAKTLKRSAETIYRVYRFLDARNSISEYYENYRANKSKSGRKLIVLPNDELEYIKEKVSLGWTPDTIIGRNEKHISCSMRTLYRIFKRSKDLDVTSLPMKGKRHPNGYVERRAIMPSKYTDEIENSSYTWRVFYMSRKSKYSAEQKLAILNELTRSNISEVAKKYAVGKKTIRTWGYLYEYQGIDGLRSTHNNHRYSKEFKLSLVQQYQKSDASLEIFAIKHGLKSKTQLSDWIMQYNESNLKAYTPRKRDSKMSGRKTDFEERLTIIEELIKHDVNYNWAVEKYHISYQQVYGWYQKYRKSGNDPESLRDRRGKAKPEEKWTEVDRLKAENRLLRAQLEKQEMEIAFAKKLTEIRNREII